MLGLAGLRVQALAGGMLLPGRGVSRGLLPLAGMSSPKRLLVSTTPPNLSNSADTSTVYSQAVAATVKGVRRGEVFRRAWAQVSGPPGQVIELPDGLVQFAHFLPSETTYPIVWRCVGYNQFGDVGSVDVAFNLTRVTPIPSLGGSASPTGATTFVPIDPGTRLGRCYFSAAGSGGVPPYTYDWGGGAFPTAASNYTDIYLPPGATSGIDFNAGCTITDSIGQSIVVVAGPFFVLEA